MKRVIHWTLTFVIYPVLVLIAGGIGATPLLSILSEFHNNPPELLEKIYFIWSAKEQNYLSFFLGKYRKGYQLFKAPILWQSTPACPHYMATCRLLRFNFVLSEYLADIERNDFYGRIEIQRYVTRNMSEDVPKKRRVINVDGDHIMTASNSSSAVAFMPGRPDFNGIVCWVCCGLQWWRDQLRVELSLKSQQYKGPLRQIHYTSF